MNGPPNAQLTHMGIYVRDLDRMISFYAEVLGLVQTDGGDHPSGGRIAFMSRSPQEHHQLVLVSGLPEGERFSRINQISFRVDTLEDLRRFHALLLEKRVAIQRAVTHGNAWSIYLPDPEGNKVELYTPSPWYVSQPFGVEVNFSDSADKLMAHTLALVRDDRSLTTHEAWAAGLQAKLQ